ncbi:MAG: PilW family protein [Terriglobia bacterium]
MSRRQRRETRDKRPTDRGFGLLEMLIAMAVTVVMLGAAFMFFDDMESMTEQVSVMSKVNENLRGASDLITKDIYTAGTSIPTGGIPIPWTSGQTYSLVKRPGPGANYFPANNGVLSVIVPGNTLSGTIDGLPSDEITVITVDENWVGLAPLQISSMSSSSSTGYMVNVTIPSGCTPAASCANLAAGQIYSVNTGDLLMFSTTGGLHALGMVTSVDQANNIIYFASDPLGLDQVCGSASTCVGSIDALGSPPYSGTYPSGMTLTKIDMVTYFIDTTSTQHKCVSAGASNPVESCPLMREVDASMELNPSSAEPVVAFGISNLQFAYDLTTGGAGTSGLSGLIPYTSPFTPSEVGKVDLSISAISPSTLRKSRRYYSNTFDTSVTVRNLEYVNQFP